MSKYIDYIMQNYGMQDSETSISEFDNLNTKKHKRTHKERVHKGGKLQSSENYHDYDFIGDVKEQPNEPNGGFPNIILCDGTEEENENKDKDNVARREVSSDKAILSISQILKNRRNM